MSDQMFFKRYEIKYLLTRSQYEAIKQEMESYMIADVHGENTIFSLYCDTPDYLLVRRSIEHPVYKEKIRLRSYGVAKPEDNVFLEIKKKYDSVVYKRRIRLPEQEMMQYINHQIPPKEDQISREIDYAMHFYHGIVPKVLLSYRRQAYYANNNHDFRITFDQDILWRDYDLNLHAGIYGEPVLSKDNVLMEVKTADTFPLWLVNWLSRNKIYKTSFSKYGEVYQTILKNKQNEGVYQYA